MEGRPAKVGSGGATRPDSGIVSAGKKKNPRATFLGLPLELRRSIYKHLLVWPEEIRLSFNAGSIDDEHDLHGGARPKRGYFFHLDHALLRACHQIHEEAGQTIYGANKFNLCSTGYPLSSSGGGGGGLSPDNGREGKIEPLAEGKGDISGFLKTIGSTNISFLRSLTISWYAVLIQIAIDIQNQATHTRAFAPFDELSPAAEGCVEAIERRIAGEMCKAVEVLVEHSHQLRDLTLIFPGDSGLFVLGFLHYDWFSRWTQIQRAMKKVKGVQKLTLVQILDFEAAANVARAMGAKEVSVEWIEDSLSDAYTDKWNLRSPELIKQGWKLNRAARSTLLLRNE